jgi:hypothetical protein
MNDLNFYLNNQLINPPKNYKELGIECDFVDGEFQRSKITINDWEFVRENIDTINLWISQGRIFEGIPFKIEEVDAQNFIENIFDGYIDLTDNTEFKEDMIVAKSKEQYSIDWLNDRADSFSFDYLYSIQSITDADFVDIPYVLSSIPDYEKAAITLVSITFIATNIGSLIPTIVSGVVAVAVDPFQYGQIVIIVAQILQFILQVTAMLVLLKQLFDLLVQQVKYHKGMKVLTLMNKGCEHLGISFNSTILNLDYPNLVILPRKFYIENNPTSIVFDILGAFSPGQISQLGYPQGTFGELIRKLITMFNGKIIFEGTTLRLERKDFNLNTPTFTIPDIYNPNYTLNTDDCVSNYFIEFLIDNLESNTITNYLGTSFQAQIRPTNVINPNFVNLRGLKQVQVEFALAKRKNELTKIEKAFDNILEVIEFIIMPFQNSLAGFTYTVNAVIDFTNDLIDAFDIIIGIDNPNLPSIPNYVYQPIGSFVSNRVGCLILEKDLFSVDKIFLVESRNGINVITQNNSTEITAKTLFDNYHIIETFIPSPNNPNYNQFKKKDIEVMPFTLENFRQIKNNASGYDSDGSLCLFESIRYNIWDKTASAKIKIAYIYTQNLTFNYFEPDGK